MLIELNRSELIILLQGLGIQVDHSLDEFELYELFDKYKGNNNTELFYMNDKGYFKRTNIIYENMESERDVN